MPLEPIWVVFVTVVLNRLCGAGCAGVSAPPQASLKLARRAPDLPADVTANTSNL
jgi:hypothetical protein